MPTLRRPDGGHIHWEEVGDGPRILVCTGFNLQASDRLIDRLASSRRVLTYDPRGLNRSSPGGPYDVETGVDDVEALLDEVGVADVVLGIGDGAHRAMGIGNRRPNLAQRVVVTTTALGRGRAGSGGFSGSTEVLAALTGLLRRDYRAGLRSMVANSGFADDNVVRERVEQLARVIPQDAAIGYLEAWIAASSVEVARRLGPRLTVLAYPGNDWFPLSMYEAMREELTEACFEFLEDGPISRPDLSVEVLVRLSEPARE